jgi:membrane peptidoglycan carboxypeptidase
LHAFFVKRTSAYQIFMLAAGILVAAGIVLSQVLFHETQPVAKKEKAATEQTENESTAALQVAPTLANHSVSVQLDSSVDAMVEQVLAEEDEVAFLPRVAEVCLPYFKTLLRTLIAPNAP